MGTFTYYKDRQRTISFPVGGLGSGCIGIAGNGCLIDWQVYNRPAMGTRNGYSHFAIKAQDETGLLDARVLVSDLEKPYMGQVDEKQCWECRISGSWCLREDILRPSCPSWMKGFRERLRSGIIIRLFP